MHRFAGGGPKPLEGPGTATLSPFSLALRPPIPLVSVYGSPMPFNASFNLNNRLLRANRAWAGEDMD